MLLNEAEGKELLKRAGLRVPKGMLISSAAELDQIDQKNLQFPVYVKAQVMHGNRALQNMVLRAGDAKELNTAVNELFNSKDQYDQPISQILIEEAVVFESELYLSIGYDTNFRQMVVNFSHKGGTGMDDRGETLEIVPLSIINEPAIFTPENSLLPTIQKLWNLFKENDATLVEINPIVRSGDEYICLDAKVELDETAKFRHEEWDRYPERSALGRPPTMLERRAQEVSRSDHRGAAGESFFEFLGGNVGVLASGGGASLLAMDALMAAGISPANYTEYSGNPPREKVKALTEVVLSIPNLEGLYVVGSNANFTDIYETLAGIVDALLESDYKNQAGFSVLIRRGGPRWQEAFAMVEERLKETNIKLKLFGPDFPVVQTALEMKEMLAQA